MKREIKDKGKGIKYDMWYYGSLVIDKQYIKPKYLICLDEDADDCDGTHCNNEDGICYSSRMIEVIPETIGQYIGLKDKNKKEIYEGDIVKLERKESTEIEGGKFDFDNLITKTYIGIVYYDEKNASFEVGGIENDYQEGFYGYQGQEFSWNELEIVGNKFENGELLEDK